jgi:hypothetical protein
MLNNGRELDYAFGLEVGPAHTNKGWQLVEHGGSQAGYSSWMIRVPEKHLSVVVLFNYFMWGMRDYAVRVLDLFLEENPDTAEESTRVTEGTPVSLEVDQMKKWVGVYYHPVRAATRQINLKEEILMFRGNPLTPLSEERFFFTEMPEYMVIFTPTTMTVVGGAEEVVYQKLDATNLAIEDLKIYEGRYYSPEIDQRWTVSAGNECLRVSRWKYPPSEMKTLFRDAFNDDWMPIMGYPTNYTVVFDREEDGDVNGLRVSGNGVRHLWFERES